MSRQRTEDLLVKLWAEIDASNARKQLEKSAHIVYLRADELSEAFKDAYLRVREKYPELPEPKNWKIFSSAAKRSIKQMRIHLAKKSVNSYETYQSRTKNSSVYLAYRSPKGGYGPIDIIKTIAVEAVNKKLKTVNMSLSTEAENGTISQQALFKTGIEFHHKGTTIGAAQLAQSFAFLSQDAYFKDFVTSGEIGSLRNLFGDFDLNFEATSDGVTKGGTSVKIRDNRSITGIFASHKKNFAGSEFNDWSKVQPELERVMKAWAEKQNWWSMPGSNSLETDTINGLTVLLLNKLKGKKGKVTTKSVTPNRKDKKVKTKIKSSTKGKITGTPRKARTYSRQTSRSTNMSPASVPLHLIAVLNKELPGTVEKNMDAPALENRTGRLASSVRITDIVQTPKGYPSIGYTYMKGPYQTFEPGYRQGSIDRDPRKLIDRSIREVAAQYAIGRFYTRRV